MAIPSRVVALDGLIATVECFDVRRDVNLLLLGEDAVSIGDYLLIQAGGFAYEKVDPERAVEALELMEPLIAAGDSAGDELGADPLPVTTDLRG